MTGETAGDPGIGNLCSLRMARGVLGSVQENKHGSRQLVGTLLPVNVGGISASVACTQLDILGTWQPRLSCVECWTASILGGGGATWLPPAFLTAISGTSASSASSPGLIAIRRARPHRLQRGRARQPTQPHLSRRGSPCPLPPYWPTTAISLPA